MATQQQINDVRAAYSSCTAGGGAGVQLGPDPRSDPQWDTTHGDLGMTQSQVDCVDASPVGVQGKSHDLEDTPNVVLADYVESQE